MIDPELLPEFVAEAGEHLDEMEANLIKLETDPDNREIINDIFRDVHTIKGSSAYLGLKVTSELAHKLENLLEMVRQGKCNADSSLIDILIAAKDRITSLVSDIESFQEERTETDDLIEAIQNCANDPDTNDKKEEHVSEATTDFDVSRQEPGNLQWARRSFPEEEFKLDLDGIYDSETNHSNVLTDTIESRNDFPTDPPPIQAASAPPSSLSEGLGESEIEESYEEIGDEELFDIYLEQLKINLSDIRELAVHISSSENRSELLSAINEKIQRLKASANYMGYDKLAGLYDRWQATLESFQDRLFLNDAPSYGVLVEEGINTYFDTIQKHFPKLQGIARVPIISEELEHFPSQPPSSEISNTLLPTNDGHGQNEAGIVEECLPQVEQDIPPGNLQKTLMSFSEEEFKLDLDGIFDSKGNLINGPVDSSEFGNDSSTDPFSIQIASATQSPLSGGPVESEREETYEETGDEELFAIYLEQLKINLSNIRELAVQISSSEKRSELLSAINKKIQRLQASANYMGYDKLAGLYDRWQATLEGFQDRLFLNDSPPSNVLIDEGINSYFDVIQRHFPKLQGIVPIPTTKEEAESSSLQFLPSEQGEIPSLTSEVQAQDDVGVVEASQPQVEDEYEEKIDTELFSIFLEQLKDNLHAVRTLGQQLSSSENPLKTISTLTEKITRIRAAANYMGYEQLITLYDEWLGELNAVCDPSTGTPNVTDIANRINDCIRTYSNKILENFPQIKKEESSAGRETEITAVEKLHSTPQSTTRLTPLLDISDTSFLLDRTDELFSPDETSAEHEDSLEELPEVVKEDTIDKEQILLNRLSAALDNALGTGVADVGDKDSAGQEVSGSKVAPDPSADDSAQMLQDLPEEKTIASDSPESSKLVQELAKSAQNDVIPAAFPEQVERRKEERRKEDRRAAPEVSAEKVLRQSLRIDANKIDELMNQAGELVINRAWFSQLFNEMRKLELYLQNIPELDKRDLKHIKGFSFKFNEAIVALGRVANELQEGVMKVRMLPISQLFNRYPRLIRDLVHDSDKDIQLELRGADTELDKMIIEEIADPLIHVIRNAVDHGIEPASIRKTKGKREKGLLKLDAYHEGSHVVVEVTDDGRGIDPEVIKATALKKGLVSKDQLSRMSSKEITELIMRPGFSTASQVTRTSGRGVGMDVVRKNLENLNGTIEIDSRPGEGTSIRIKIPLTLAVIKALLVTVRNSLFTIPLIAVDETLRVRDKDIHSIKGNQVIYLRDSTIPLIRLSTIFNLPVPSSQGTDEEKTFVVIVSTGNSRVGLVVDDLRGQEEVVIKPLPDYLRDNKGFSGATILGDGRISLILDIHELVNLTIGRQSRRLSKPLQAISETL